MHYDQAIEVSSFFFAVALLSSSLTASAQRDKIDHCLHQHFDFATLTHFYTSLLIIPINLLFNFCKCKGLPPSTPPPPLSHSLPRVPHPCAVLPLLLPLPAHTLSPALSRRCVFCCCESASASAAHSPSTPPAPLSHSLPCVPHPSAVLLPPRMDAVVTCQSWPMIDM